MEEKKKTQDVTKPKPRPRYEKPEIVTYNEKELFEVMGTGGNPNPSGGYGPI